MNNSEEKTNKLDEEVSEAAEFKRRILHPIKYRREKEAEGISLDKTRSPGVILTLLFAIGEGILKTLRDSKLAYFFSYLYSALNARCKNGFLHSLVRREKKKSAQGTFRSKFAKIYEESLVNRIILWMSERIIQSSLRIWGTGMFAFAFVTVFLAMVKYYFTAELLSSNVIIGIGLAFLSLPLLVSKKRLGESLISGTIPRFITMDILRLDAMKYERDDTKSGGNYVLMLIAAAALGVFTYFVDPWVLVGIVTLVALLVVIMCFPELGIVAVLGLIPFSNVFERPSIAIFTIILFSGISFMFKLMRAKRVIEIELMDVFVLLFGATLVLGGIFTSGGVESLYSAVMYAVFLSIYFLVANAFIRKTWIYRAIKLIVITTSIVAIVGLFEDGVVSSSWVDMSVFADIGARISSFLGNPNMLGVYLVIVFPLVLAQMLVTKRKIVKFIYVICAASVLGCIVLTWSRGAWLGLIVSVLIFLIIYNFKNIWIVFAGIATLPLWSAFLPQSILDRFMSILHMSDSSVIYRFNTWRGVLNMIWDNLLGGIGVGESAFKNSYGAYAVPGTETVMHSHNLYLEITLQLGLIGLILFGVAMFAFIQKSFICIRSREQSSKSRTMIAAGLAGIAGALTMGLTDYIWYNYRVFLIFWAVVALNAALVRINEKQLAKENAGAVNNLKSVDTDIYL